jgi:hypothetical protein
MTDLATPSALGIALGELELAHGSFGFDQQGGAGFGQADLALLADEQARTQRRFHVLDLAAQRRWRNAQLLGGPGEVALAGYSQEVAKMTDVHNRISSKVMKCFTAANKDVAGRD